MIYSLGWICIQDCSTAGEQITSLEISTCGDVPVSTEPQNEKTGGGGDTGEALRERETKAFPFINAAHSLLTES